MGIRHEIELDDPDGEPIRACINLEKPWDQLAAETQKALEALVRAGAEYAQKLAAERPSRGRMN